MLKIYTSKEIAKQQSKLDIVPDILVRFNLVYVDTDNMFKDAISERILTEIEGMTQRYDNGVIVGKFGAVPISNISEGGKGLLLATTFNTEFIMNIDPLGYNCIYLLFDISKKLDIEIISTRVLYHMKPEFKAIVNGVECEGMNISFEMESYNQ